MLVEASSGIVVVADLSCCIHCIDGKWVCIDGL